MKTAQEALNEETQIALGKFVIAFSHVLVYLEHSTTQLHRLSGNPLNEEAQAKLAKKTAGPLAEEFYKAFKDYWNGSLTSTDSAVFEQIESEVNQLVEDRNRVMHDAWLTTTDACEETAQEMATLRVFAAGKRVAYEMKSRTPMVILLLAADASRLAEVVRFSVSYRPPNPIGPEMRQRIALVDGKITARPHKLQLPRAQL